MKKSMSKKISMIIFSFIIPPLFALEVHIAPISYIDTIEERVFSRREIARDIVNGTENYLYGKNLFFREIKSREINAPVSLIDAVNVSRVERADYLLYGFVEKREHTYRAEIRLLDFEKRVIRRIFYSSDDIENYERLIGDLSYKIVSYFDSVFNLGVKEDVPGQMILSVPVSLGYWTYISSAWINTMTGTAAMSTGLDLITNNKALSGFSRATYIAWNLNIEYRYGIGKEDVELRDMRIITLSLPLRVHIESLRNEDSVFFGLGLLYELDIANIEETYKGDKRSLYSHMGMLMTFGYKWKFNEKIRIGFDNIVTVGFQDKPMVSYSPRVTMLYQIYTKEIIDKWR